MLENPDYFAPRTNILVHFLHYILFLVVELILYTQLGSLCSFVSFSLISRAFPHLI